LKRWGSITGKCFDTFFKNDPRKGFVKKSLSSLTLHKEVRYTVCNSRIFRPPTFREIFPLKGGH
jgi:hypothetical protein